MLPDFRAKAHLLVDQLADHLEAAASQEKRAIPYQSPETVYAFWENFQGSFQEMTTAVLAQSTAVHHPGYVGHQVAVPQTEAILASWISDALNNGSAVYEMGMAALAIEKRVTQQLCKAFDLPDQASGIFTSGGSLANLTAMLAARAHYEYNQAPQQQYCVLVSDQAHYCIDRAVRIMGWGPGGIVELKTDEQYKVLPDSLPAGLKEAQKRGRTPIAIVGMACSTSTGTYDNLEMLAAFAKTHGLWFHVDAAHGGVASFSESKKHLTKGINQADSITLDAHKMMEVPALTTALLYAREADSYRTFAQKADYLWGEAGPEWYHSGQRTVECTKLMMGMRLFAQLQAKGFSGIGAYVDQVYALASAFAKTLEQHDHWELAVMPQSNIVCFRHVPKHLTTSIDLDEHNATLREKYLLDGRFYVVNTKLHGTYWLRVTLMNPTTTLDHLTTLLDLAESF